VSPRFPLATSSWDEAEQAALQRVIASGHFTMGPSVAQFEQDFAAYVGARHCVMVNSGSSANLLAVAALFYTRDAARRLKPGDEVIVPAVSWSTTYFPLHQYGLKLRFVDIDPETLNMDLGALAAAIDDRTRMVMAVNLLGNPNDFDAIRAIVGGRDIVLVEDNCEAMGARFGGRAAGTHGLLGTFSSFFSHHISTMEGGMVVTDDEELHQILVSVRAHGWTRQLPKHNLVCGEKSDDPFEESFRFVLPGYNLRPLEMSGALGIEQVRKLPGLIEGRRANGRLYQGRLADHPLMTIQRETGESSWFGFSLVLRPGVGVTRRMLRDRLVAEGFEVRPIVAGNFTKNAAVRFIDHEIVGTLAAADHIDANGLFVGNHHYPLDAMIDCLGDILDAL
jgi:CDP-6-deoxy-D-xylo-4-hexulose-3-dehydrase